MKDIDVRQSISEQLRVCGNEGGKGLRVKCGKMASILKDTDVWQSGIIFHLLAIPAASHTTQKGKCGSKRWSSQRLYTLGKCGSKRWSSQRLWERSTASLTFYKDKARMADECLLPMVTATREARGTHQFSSDRFARRC